MREVERQKLVKYGSFPNSKRNLLRKNNNKKKLYAFRLEEKRDPVELSKDLEVLVLPSQLLEEQVYSALEQGQPNRCLVFQMVRRPSQAQDLS